MTLFQKSILNSITQDEGKVALRWAEYQKFLAKVDAIKGFKEEEYQDGFFKDIFENCLGYTLKTTNPSDFNLEREKKNETDGKKADGVIYINGEIIGVVELKDQKTKQLDSIEAQAFNYHNSHSNSKYVIISNFDELRFYIDKKTAYEKFNLFSLSYDEFKKLHLLLSFESIKENIPQKLKDKSSTFEQTISKELYKDFTIFRTGLFENIIQNNQNSDKSLLLRLTQKLCDRVIFILFAEDRGLLRHNTIKEIREEFANQRFTDYTLYDIYKFYFEGINTGNTKLNIPKYNGGLFATDECLDNLIIDDLCLNENAQKLSNYDFVSDISVNILGHIFEQSLSDLEELNASLNNVDFDKKNSKRKKDGVFYTPEYITRYIVENTLGKLCEEKKESLNVKNVEAPKNSKKPTKEEALTKENLELYKNWLLHVKILDPACGSGAFLNQALEYLIKEHKELQEKLVIMGDITAYYDVETSILENNLYGVDINEDAVEIARLSLWLRTAQQGRALANLSDKIKCANSLLDMPFAENSFDVVIGNPPYVRADSLGNSLEFRECLVKSKYFETLSGKWDLYIPFVELSVKLAKQNGKISLIIPDAYCHADYANKSLEWTKTHRYLFQIDYFPEFLVFENVGVKSVIVNFQKDNSIGFTQRIHHGADSYSEIIFDSYPNSMRIDAKDSLLNQTSNYYLLSQICYSTKGIVGNSDEKKYQGEFLVGELLSEVKNDTHSKLYFEGKDIRKWLLLKQRWIEFNTERSPSKWSRKGFLEMFEGSPKLVTMRSPAYFPRTMLDEDNGYFNESAIGFKRWIDLKNINNKSLNNACSNELERSEFEKISTFYSYPFLLAIFNSSVIRYELNSNRRSNIHIYPEDWKILKIPRINDADNEKIAIEIDKKAILMLELNKQLQSTKQNFLNELKLEKIPKKLENFDELTFDEFVTEYQKAKKLKFTDKLEERTFKNNWNALFENDKTLTCNLKTEIAKTDKEINAMVYELYGLSEDEIKIVEGS